MINQGASIALGYQQLTSIDASSALTIPAGTAYCTMQCEAQAIRWRDDGTAPTTTVGMPLAVGVQYVYDAGQLTVLRVISQVAGAKLNVCYYGRL
jgi:hypothetical protein